MKAHHEIEAKYDLAADQAVPDLIGHGGVHTVVGCPEMVLTAGYYDTAGHALAAAGATLRRRTGGTDDGWHLKLPLADGERLELHRALGRGQTPPTALIAPVRALLRSDPLVPVATLVTRRTVHRLLDSAGTVLAELADDSVVGERHGDEPTSVRWRELEVELVDGDRDVLAALDEAVRATGIRPAAGTSKVGRVLGSAPARPRFPDVRRRMPVGAVLDDVVRYAAAMLVAVDPLVRVDRPEAQTMMRHRVRALGAALAMQRQAGPGAAVVSLRSELAWLEGVLAAVDDLDAVRPRLRTALAEQPPELVLGPVVRRIDRELGAARRAAVDDLRAALDSSRYLALVESLVGLHGRRMTDPAAEARAGTVLPELARRAVRRTERRLVQLRQAQSDNERRWALAGAQRAVEGAMLANRLVRAGTSRNRAELASTLDEVGLLLRDLAVGAVAQQRLRAMGAQTQGTGENGFTFGRLHGLEDLRADGTQRRLGKLRKQLRGRRDA